MENLNSLKLCLLAASLALCGPNLAAQRRSGGIEVREAVFPRYSPVALTAKVQGLVRVAVSVGNGGRVRSAVVLSGNPMLAATSLLAAKRWRFSGPSSTRVVLEFSYVALPPNTSYYDAYTSYSPPNKVVIRGRIFVVPNQSGARR
jgi:TonB family protein